MSPENSILEENSSFSTLENIVDRKYANVYHTKDHLSQRKKK
jgi:hypothetical protein